MSVEAEAKTRARTLQELRKFDGTLYVKNNTVFKVNIHDDFAEKPTMLLELDPAGCPESIAILPKKALEQRPVQRMWLSGKITVSTDETMDEEITLLMSQSVGATAERIASLTGLDANGKPIATQMMNSNQAKNVVEKACLQCGRFDVKTGVIVTGRVIQTVKDVKDGVPPLCELHTSLVSQYVPRQVQKDGEEHWEFDRIGMSAPVIVTGN